MKKLVVLLMAMLVASSAFAVIDPDNNMMGVYFDMSADTVCMLNVGPNTAVPAYVILTNPTFPSVYGYEAGFEMVGGSHFLLGVTLAATGLNVGDNLNHIVGFAGPIPCTEATLLSTFNILYVDGAGTPLSINLHNATPASLPGGFPVVLLEGGELVTIGQSSASGLVAQINECNVVATDEMSFDSVKSLYR